MHDWIIYCSYSSLHVEVSVHAHLAHTHLAHTQALLILILLIHSCLVDGGGPPFGGAHALRLTDVAGGNLEHQALNVAHQGLLRRGVGGVKHISSYFIKMLCYPGGLASRDPEARHGLACESPGVAWARPLSFELSKGMSEVDTSHASGI